MSDKGPFRAAHAAGLRRRLMAWVVLLVAGWAGLAAVSLRANPDDPACLPWDGLATRLFNRGTVVVPSMSFLEPNHPHLLTIAQGSDRLHIDVHDLDGRVVHTRHGVDERLCFATSPGPPADADGDGRDDLLYSAHYRDGGLVPFTDRDVDSVQVGYLTCDGDFAPFWCLRRPTGLPDGDEWNVEVALPEAREANGRETHLLVNVSGMGSHVQEKRIGLFRKGAPPRLVRVLELGVTANACLELPGPSFLIGGRAPGQGSRQPLAWADAEGRLRADTARGDRGSAFLVDSEGGLRWAKVFGSGLGATLVHTLGTGEDSLLCTFIAQGSTPSDMAHAVRIWVDRGSGETLASEVLSGLFRPFMGPAAWNLDLTGLLKDSLGVMLVGRHPGDRRSLRDVPLPDNGFPVPVLDVGGVPAFAVAEGKGVTAFALDGRRLAMVTGFEPATPVRFGGATGETDRLLVLEGDDRILTALEAKRGPGWILWRHRWPLGAGLVLLALVGTLMGWEVARAAERHRHQEWEQHQQRELASANSQLNHLVLQLQGQLERSTSTITALRSHASSLLEIIDSQQDAILVLDDRQRLVQANLAFVRLFAVTRGSLGLTGLSGLGSDLLEDLWARWREGRLPFGDYYLQQSRVPAGLFRVTPRRLEHGGEGPDLVVVFLHNKDEQVRTPPRPRRDYGHPEIIGDSPALVDILRQIEEARDTTSNALILGESGTGKELVAKALHNSSPVAKGPMWSINCASLPVHLMESELFGHERGAFTDAKERKIGLIEQANGGTFLLDEIGDMDSGLQAKLLRVLDERAIRRVGGNRLIPVDVRFMAATHQDLHEKMERKEFRQDLYYRLGVVVLRMPPLRDRREDIPLLADHFLHPVSQKLKRGIRGIDPDALDLLAAYPWPGNVRQLANVMERAVLACHGDRLLPAHLPEEVRLHRREAPPSPLPRDGRVARDELKSLLDAHAWNVSLVARRLGMSRQTVHNLLNKHGLKRPGDEDGGTG